MRNDEVYSIGIVPNYNDLVDIDWLKIVFVHQIKVLRAEQLDDINNKNSGFSLCHKMYLNSLNITQRIYKAITLSA